MLIDNSSLAANMQEKKKDYQKVFALKVRDGFKELKNHFTPLGIDQKVGLRREFMKGITQPGRTGVTNFPTEFLNWKERIPELKPVKVDLFLDELALYKLRTSFLSEQEPADLTDINSIAGRNFIMTRVFKSIGKDVQAAVFNGVAGFQAAGNTTAFQGGLNLFDGLGIKLQLGLAAAGSVAGAVGDIPATNKVTNRAATFTETNALEELKKFRDLLFATDEFVDIATSGDPEDENYIHMPPAYFLAMVTALDNLPYKSNQLVEAAGNGMYQFKAMPGVKIKQMASMKGNNGMFWSPKANLFYLYPENIDEVSSIKIQEKDRGIQILIDAEMNVDYADGRQIVVY